MTGGAYDLLGAYRWPGNVRELENLMERLVVLAADGSVITAEDLPPGIVPDASEGHAVEARDLREAVQVFEKRYILSVLSRTGWNRVETARRLNIHRNTLLLKMKELGIRDRGENGRRSG